MASKKIGLVLALDKDKEFRDALKACKDEVKAYKDSVKELDDKFKANEGTLDDLKKKNEELAKKQEAYAKQVDAAKAGLERANDTYKKQADHLTELRDKLREAEDAQQKLKDEGLEGTEAYKKQCDEVDKLRDAVAKQAANVAVAEQKVNSWTREVRNAEKGLEQCNTDLEDNARDMQEFGKQADDAGDDVEEFAKDVGEAADQSGKLSVSLGDMVKNKIVDLAGDALRRLGEKAVEAAKYVVEVGSSFEAQMDKVGAISGATSSDMERLTDKAKEMGATTKFSATESGEALEYMAMAGWDTNDMLDGLEGIMNLAAASGEDLATTSDIVTDALTAFGRSAEDSGRLADIMAAASSNANTNVAMMGETFKYAAPVAGALGYSMEDTSIAIGLMANAGIKASQAGTSLRAGLTNLVKPGKEAATAMERYKISVTDEDGKMLSFRDMMVQLREKLGGLDEASQAAAAASIFGKNAMSGWLAIINSSDEDFDKLTAAVDGSTGAAERMAGTMQDNLSGKITILQSALEGLGIAAYDYVKGPLTSVVEGVTGIISGITDILAPQRSELERFLDDVKQANDQVQRSIDHARETVSNGQARAAEIDAYKGMLDGILDSCEQFNYVDLGNGKYQILDATGAVVEEGFKQVDAAAGTTEAILDAWASGGLNTAGVKSSTDEVQDMIGYVAEKADTVENRLKTFAAQGIDTSGVETGRQAIVQIFDDMGNEVDAFETNVSKSGAVEIDTSGVTDGTDVMITCFNDATGEVESFRGSIDQLGTGKVNLSHITTEFERVGDSVRQTYVITDEFTKAKINTMVDTLGDSVEGLAEAWNAQTGELTASHEELIKWFDTAKEVAMYKALEDALQELYDAWGKAMVNCATAQAGMNEAIRQFNEENGTAYETFEELQDATGVVYGGYGKVGKAVEEAHDALVDANTEFTRADKELNSTAEALAPLKESLDAARQSTDEAGISAEEAAQSLEGLGDAEEEAAESAGELTDAQAAVIDRYKALFGATDEYLQKQNELSETDLAEWCEEHVTKYLDQITEEFENLVDSVSDSMANFATAMQTTNEEGEISLQSMVNSLLDKQQKIREWTDNMMALGSMAGSGFSQALYDDLLKEGPEKGYEKVQAIVDAMRAGTPEFEALSREYDNALALSASPEGLVSFSSTGKEYARAVQTGFEGTMIEYYDVVESTVEGAAETAASAAEGFSEAGQKGGTATKEGIQGASAEVSQAAEAMIDQARQASDRIAVNFNMTGQIIPQELRRGINAAKMWSDKAVTELMDSMQSIVSGRNPEFQTKGQGLIKELEAGIRNATPGADSAVKSLADGAIQTVQGIADDFGGAGVSAADSLRAGIDNGYTPVTNAVSTVVQGGANTASGMSYAFEGAGYNMMVGMGNGIASGTGYVQAMAQNAAVSALNAAQAALGIASPSKEFRKMGAQSTEGFALGFKDGEKEAEDSVRDVMSGVMDTASKGLSDLKISGSVSIDGPGIFDGLAGALGRLSDLAKKSLKDVGEGGLDEFGALLEQTGILRESMEQTGTNAGSFFADLQDGAEKALESALAMQELDRSMADAQGRFMDMSAVISGLLGQMSALSQAVSGMDVSPSVSVRIGNREIKNFIVEASMDGLAKSQQDLAASQGWG